MAMRSLTKELDLQTQDVSRLPRPTIIAFVCAGLDASKAEVRVKRTPGLHLIPDTKAFRPPNGPSIGRYTACKLFVHVFDQDTHLRQSVEGCRGKNETKR